MAWRAYVREVSDAIAELGYGGVARRLSQCGTTASVRTCNTCGDPNATVTIHAGCDVRACPWCSRRSAAERVRVVQGAVDRVEGYVHTRRDEHLRELVARDGELDARRRVSAASREQQRRVRRAIHATRAAAVGRAGWGWKLVTISPRWDPTDPCAYSVAALRHRVEDVRARWRALWSEGLSVEGLAAAYTRVELSDRGHVHLHALYFGPWQSDRWCAGVAGCFVDVRVIEDEGGLREAVKYALKGPSPGNGAWIGGARGDVAHPTLAARWVVAMRGRRLAEPYGLMRDAMRAAEVCEPADERAPAPCVCASCGSTDLSDARLERTVALARELQAIGAWTLRAKDGRAARVSVELPTMNHGRNV